MAVPADAPPSTAAPAIPGPLPGRAWGIGGSPDAGDAGAWDGSHDPLVRNGRAQPVVAWDESRSSSSHDSSHAQERQAPQAGNIAGQRVVPPAGFEPALPPPEGGALSPELRGRYRRTTLAHARGSTSGSGCPAALGEQLAQVVALGGLGAEHLRGQVADLRHGRVLGARSASIAAPPSWWRSMSCRNSTSSCGAGGGAQGGELLGARHPGHRGDAARGRRRSWSCVRARSSTPCARRSAARRRPTAPASPACGRSGRSGWPRCRRRAGAARGRWCGRAPTTPSARPAGGARSCPGRTRRPRSPAAGHRGRRRAGQADEQPAGGAEQQQPERAADGDERPRTQRAVAADRSVGGAVGAVSRAGARSGRHRPVGAAPGRRRAGDGLRATRRACRAPAAARTAAGCPGRTSGGPSSLQLAPGSGYGVLVAAAARDELVDPRVVRRRTA